MDGFPSDIVAADPTAGSVTITLATAVYPLEAVYGAAYIFLDRCYVLLDKPSESTLSVTLAAKNNASPEVLRAFTGEFANELLSQAWRQKILDENRVILETVTAQALAGAMGPPPEPAAPSLDELASFDFSDEGFDDPLGIAMSWEEKYKKKPEGTPPSAKPEGEP